MTKREYVYTDLITIVLKESAAKSSNSRVMQCKAYGSDVREENDTSKLVKLLKSHPDVNCVSVQTAEELNKANGF